MYSFGRDKLLADGLADRICEAFAVPRDHSLRKDRNAHYFERLTRPKEHPHGQPRSGITMKCRKRDQEADLNVEMFKDRFDCVD